MFGIGDGWWGPYWGNIPLACSGMSKRKLAKFNNNIEFSNAFNTLFSLAMDMFEWDGLPLTCDAVFLERALIVTGKAMFAEVDGSILTLGAANGAGVNVNGYSVNGYGYGANGFNKEFPLYVPGGYVPETLQAAGSQRKGEAMAVICWDNVTQYPMVNYIIQAAKRLSDLMNACDVAIQSLKLPFIIQCDEVEANSVRQILNDRSSNLEAIVTSKSIAMDSFKIWDTHARPEVLKAFWEQYQQIKADVLEKFGIDANANPDKRERLVVAEATANQDVTNRNAQKRLEMRERFCDQVNELFGLNVSVKLKEVQDIDLLRGFEDIVGDSADDADGGASEGD